MLAGFKSFLRKSLGLRCLLKVKHVSFFKQPFFVATKDDTRFFGPDLARCSSPDRPKVGRSEASFLPKSSQVFGSPAIEEDRIANVYSLEGWRPLLGWRHRYEVSFAHF